MVRRRLTCSKVWPQVTAVTLGGLVPHSRSSCAHVKPGRRYLPRRAELASSEDHTMCLCPQQWLVLASDIAPEQRRRVHTVLRFLMSDAPSAAACRDGVLRSNCTRRHPTRVNEQERRAVTIRSVAACIWVQYLDSKNSEGRVLTHRVPSSPVWPGTCSYRENQPDPLPTAPGLVFISAL